MSQKYDMRYLDKFVHSTHNLNFGSLDLRLKEGMVYQGQKIKEFLIIANLAVKSTHWTYEFNDVELGNTQEEVLTSMLEHIGEYLNDLLPAIPIIEKKKIGKDFNKLRDKFISLQ